MNPWTYVQSTGELLSPEQHILGASGTFWIAGAVVAVGYAGRNTGLNNPAMQDVHDIGPLPVGFYTCAAPIYHSRLGPDAIPLVPFPSNEMFTRGGFYVHGDNAAHDNSASEGCIVLDAPTRARLAPGTVIEVVAQRPDASA